MKAAAACGHAFTNLAPSSRTVLRKKRVYYIVLSRNGSCKSEDIVNGRLIIWWMVFDVEAMDDDIFSSDLYLTKLRANFSNWRAVWDYDIQPAQYRLSVVKVWEGCPDVLCAAWCQRVPLGREIGPALWQDGPVPFSCTRSSLTVMDLMCTGEEINSYVKRITSLI